MASKEGSFEIQSHRSTAAIYLMAFCAALGSFCFGYFIGVLNTSWTYIAYINNWVGKTSYESLASGLLPVGAAIGALLSGKLTDEYGRRGTFLITDILTIAGVIPTLVPNITWLLVGRVITGLTVGINSAAVPLYISEIAPGAIRGTVATFHQMLICFGLLTTAIFGFGIPKPGPDGRFPAEENHFWRVMLGFPIVICLIRSFFLLIRYKHETPSFLARKRGIEVARMAVSELYRDEFINDELGMLASGGDGGDNASFLDQFNDRNRGPLMVGILLMIFQQISGINAVMFFSNKIFKGSADQPVSETTATLYTTMTMLLNFGACFITSAIIDKAGRKIILLVGGVFVTFFLALLALFNHRGEADLARYCVLAYVLAFAISWGPVPWVMVGEVLSGKGGSIATLVNWLFCIMVVQSLPYVEESEIGINGAFIFYMICMVVALLYTQLYVKETKGLSKEQINRIFSNLPKDLKEP